MPSANTSLHARAMLRAHGHESVFLTWTRPGLADVVFSATKNAAGLRRWDREDERVVRNDGHSTGCQLTAIVDATAPNCLRPAAMPDQGALFTDPAGFRYRVARRDYTPGLPSVVFHIPQVVPQS